MEKYKPERDLPEDIQQLPRAETVCQFCGVSYLVHHEIKRLEDTVESMKGELTRLRELEDQKALWETEREELVRARRDKEKETTETLSRLQSLRSELSTVTLHCEQQETQLQEEKRQLNEMKKREAHMVSSLEKMKDMVLQLKEFQGHMKKLVRTASSQMASTKDQILEKCLQNEQRLTQVHTQLRSRTAELLQALELKQRECSKLQSETETTQRKLLEQVTKSAATQKELEAKLAAAEGCLHTRGVEDEQKEKMMNALTKQVRLLESRVREITDEGERLCGEKDKHIRKLQTKLRETDTRLASTLNTLSSREEQLEQMKETFTVEKQLLERRLTQAEEEEGRARRARREMEAMRRSYSERIEELKSAHQKALTNLRKSLTEEHAKELQVAEGRYRAAHSKEQGKLTELRSSLAVAELEHKRVIQELREQLQKEKSVLDRELSRHLEEVKELELKLAHEQREREKANARVTAVQVESGQQLEVKESQYSELKTKLSSAETKLNSAYQEISALQTVVQRECEEREELLQTVAELKAQRTQTAQKRLKHHQTK